MDTEPHPAPAARERLAGQIPRLRRLARALACEEEGTDALVEATVRRALAHDEGQRFIGLLLDCWREQSRNDRPDAAHEVDAAMGALPAEQREAVALVLVGGLGYAEAAGMLDIPADALAERLARGREALAARLAA